MPISIMNSITIFCTVEHPFNTVLKAIFADNSIYVDRRAT